MGGLMWDVIIDCRSFSFSRPESSWAVSLTTCAISTCQQLRCPVQGQPHCRNDRRGWESSEGEVHVPIRERWVLSSYQQCSLVNGYVAARGKYGRLGCPQQSIQRVSVAQVGKEAPSARRAVQPPSCIIWDASRNCVLAAARSRSSSTLYSDHKLFLKEPCFLLRFMRLLESGERRPWCRNLALLMEAWAPGQAFWEMRTASIFQKKRLSTGHRAGMVAGNVSARASDNGCPGDGFGWFSWMSLSTCPLFEALNEGPHNLGGAADRPTIEERKPSCPTDSWCLQSILDIYEMDPSRPIAPIEPKNEVKCA